MEKSEYMTTREAQDMLRVSAQTLRNWRAEGRIHVYTTPGGRPRYSRSELERIAGSSPMPKAKRITVGYCRVSTLGQKDDLERQKQVVQNYCENNGYRFKIMSDIGSGINFRRRSFCQMLDSILSGSVERIVVNYQDRLCRFGFDLIRQICDACCTEIEVINQTDDITDEKELAQDVISIITVFSARLYGKRSHRNRENIQKAKEMFADEQSEKADGEKAVQTDKVREDDV